MISEKANTSRMSTCKDPTNEKEKIFVEGKLKNIMDLRRLLYSLVLTCEEG